MTWLLDDAIPVTGVVAVDHGDTLVGLANTRTFHRPSSGTVGTYLDDLFVEPDACGRGAGRALIQHIANGAHAAGHSVVRWITVEDNHSARSLYDHIGVQTSWVTYDKTPAPSRRQPIVE